MAKDIVKNLRGGLGLAGKLISKSVGEVGKVVSSPSEAKRSQITGLYHVANLGIERFNLRPRIHFCEHTLDQKTQLGIFSNLTLSQSEKTLIRALDKLVQGRVKQAKEELDSLTQDSQENKVELTDAYFVLGSLMMTMGNFSEAIKVFKTALLCQQGLGQKLPNYLPSFCNMIHLTPLTRIHFYPDFIGLNLLLSLSYHLNGQTALALDSLEQLLAVHPGEAHATFFASLILLQEKRYKELFQALQGHVGEGVLDTFQTLILGKTCCVLGDPITAKEIYEKALSGKTAEPFLKLELKYGLAQTYKLQGWVQDCEEALAEIYRSSPDFEPFEERFSLAEKEELIKEASRGSDLQEIANKEPKASRELIDLPPAKPPLKNLEINAPHVLKFVPKNSEHQIDTSKLPLTIGRSEGDLVIPSEELLSSEHAQITQEGSQLHIQDLGSTNGTWVNGHKIHRKVRLHRGDLVQMGALLWMLE